METYFNIRYEFDKAQIHQRIDARLEEHGADYICVADGNILSVVNRDEKFRTIVNGGLFTICDSAYVPLFLRLIYGIDRNNYTGSDIFSDILTGGKHRMFFLGSSKEVLSELKKKLVLMNPDVEGMRFEELPFCNLDEFDYEEIAKTIEEDGSDIIWISLGAPKQEYFMHRLKPYLNRGVMIAIGAAFKFFSGLDEKRAPMWMRKHHLEFLYRLLSEPKKQIPRVYGFTVRLPIILFHEFKRCRSGKV